MQLDSVLTRALIGSCSPPDPFECRACGTSLERDRATCPVCGSDAIIDIPV